MSSDETMSYVLYLRALLWERQHKPMSAIDDYRQAIKLFPERASSYNNLAWLVATTDFPERKQMTNEALHAAQRAVSLRKNANSLDTLACTYAVIGDFTRAASTEREALAADPGNSTYIRRIKQFEELHKDCTGE